MAWRDRRARTARRARPAPGTSVRRWRPAPMSCAHASTELTKARGASLSFGGRFVANRAHDENSQQRDRDGVDVLRSRYTDAEREPDAWHAERIHELGAEE